MANDKDKGKDKKNRYDPTTLAADAAKPYERGLEDDGDGAAPKKPYSDFGGIDSVADARRKFAEQIKSSASARIALADKLKPQSRKQEYERTRNVALGQAVGQLLGTVFSGVVSSGKGGFYRPAVAPDLASKSYEKANELREKGLLEQRDHDKLIYNLKSDIEGEKLSAAQQELKDTLAADALRRKLQAQAEENAARRAHEKELWGMRLKAQGEMQDKKDAAAMKRSAYDRSTKILVRQAGGGTKSVQVSPLAAYFLPETKTTTKREERYDTTTTTEAPVTKYNQADIAKAEDAAKNLLQKADKELGADIAGKLTAEQLFEINEAINAGIIAKGWSGVAAVLGSEEATPDELMEVLSANK